MAVEEKEEKKGSAAVEEEQEVKKESEALEESEENKQIEGDADESSDGSEQGDKEDSSEGEGEAGDEGAEDEPSAEELKDRIKALEDENESLKGKKEEKSDEKPSDNGVAKPVTALKNFVDHTLPATKKAFAEAAKSVVTVNEDGSLKINQESIDKQFESIITTTDQFLGAVFHDKQDPINRELGRSVIDVSNELELTQLFIKPDGTVNKRAMSLASTIRKQLKGMDWVKRAESQVVTGLYHKLIGAETETMPKNSVKPSAPHQTKIVKDAAAGAGGGTGRRPVTTVTLTAEQEAERKQIEDEAGHPYTSQQYAAKLKARQDLAKQNNRKVPQTLKSV